MKTIFITLFQGVEAKNILRTDIYKTLIDNPEARIVFFVWTKERADYYKKEFSHPRVFYEVVPQIKPRGFDAIFSLLKFKLLKTETSDLRRKMAFELNKNILWYGWNWLVNRILAHRWIRKVVRWLDYQLARTNFFGEYFEKYNPNLVFCAHLFDDLESHLLREARRRAVPVIGFVNSWDKLTARNIMRLVPEKLIVFNELVKEEALKHADMSADDIVISGIPQYDWHINHTPLSRDAFFGKKGLDPSKKLIVYAPMGKAFSNSDWDIIDLLHSVIESEEIGTHPVRSSPPQGGRSHSPKARATSHGTQLFVRFPPNDFIDDHELQTRPWLKYDYPGVRFSTQRGINWDMSFDDIVGLTDTLANADLFICYASSMSVDAALLDVPVINIDFEVKDQETLSKSPTHFYAMTHYAKAVATGGIRYPKSKEEFLRDINDYLNDPSRDKEKRAQLVKEQCWKTDGQSGKRIADYILGMLN